MAKKPAAKVAKPEVTLEQLVAVAEDFNTFMFTDGEEGIDLELDQEDMLKEITELCIDLVDTDVVSADTAATLALLGIACPAEVAAEAGEDVDDEPTEDDNDTTETDAQRAADLALVKKSTKIDKIKEIAKLYKISIPPPFLKDLAKLKPYVVGKLDGSAPVKVKAEKAAKAPKEKKEKKEKKQGVMDALRVITCKNENITQEALTKQIESAGFVVTQRTIFSVLNDTQKIIAELKSNGRMK